jgi:hypothetical protein
VLLIDIGLASLYILFVSNILFFMDKSEPNI